MDRRSFLRGAVALPAVAFLPGPEQRIPRHRVVDVTTRIVATRVHKASVQFALDGNFSEVADAIDRFKVAARRGDKLSIRMNGNVIGTVTV